MRKTFRFLPIMSIVAVVGCVTNSKVVTDPAGLNVAINGKDFGPSPCDIQSVGTTFGEYKLELKDPSGKVVHTQNLPKNVRIWGIFWPPYGVFYNLYEFHPQYTVRQVKTASGENIWSLTTP